MATENKFPTINDLNKALSDLIERGLGGLSVQILVAPDSTMQALARNMEPDYVGKPALMIELNQGFEGRLPVSIISTDRLSGDKKSSSTTTQ